MCGLRSLKELVEDAAKGKDVRAVIRRLSARLLRRQVLTGIVEVMSRGTARFDGTIKLGWYRQYGVRECWLLDPAERVVTVINLEGATADEGRRFTDSEAIRSAVLPHFAREAAEFFS